jgi:hypothetical protein
VHRSRLGVINKTTDTQVSLIAQNVSLVKYDRHCLKMAHLMTSYHSYHEVFDCIEGFVCMPGGRYRVLRPSFEPWLRRGSLRCLQGARHQPGAASGLQTPLR